VSRIVVASLALACASSARGQGFPFPPPLELRIPKPPTVAIGENGPFLTYEVHVTSFIRQPIRLKKLEVFDAGTDHRLLLSLVDSVLMRAVERPGMAGRDASVRAQDEVGVGLRYDDTYKAALLFTTRLRNPHVELSLGYPF
jgi:hypothetical protein